MGSLYCICVQSGSASNRTRGTMTNMTMCLINVGLICRASVSPTPVFDSSNICSMIPAAIVQRIELCRGLSPIASGGPASENPSLRTSTPIPNKLPIPAHRATLLIPHPPSPLFRIPKTTPKMGSTTTTTTTTAQPKKNLAPDRHHHHTRTRGGGGSEREDRKLAGHAKPIACEFHEAKSRGRAQAELSAYASQKGDASYAAGRGAVVTLLTVRASAHALSAG